VLPQGDPQSFLIACDASLRSVLVDTVQSDVELSW
jgi:hypothetical protein